MNMYVICRCWEVSWEDKYGDLESSTSMQPFAAAEDATTAWKLVRNELAIAPVKDVEKFSITVHQFIETTQFKFYDFGAAKLLRYMADDTNPLEAK